MSSVVTLEPKNSVSLVLESRADARLWDDAIALWDDAQAKWDATRTSFGLESKNVVSLTLELKN